MSETQMKPPLLHEALTCFSNLRNYCAPNSKNAQHLYHIIEHLIVFFLVMLTVFSGWLVFYSDQIANPLRPWTICVCIELNETFEIILYNLFISFLQLGKSRTDELSLAQVRTAS